MRVTVGVCVGVTVVNCDGAAVAVVGDGVSTEVPQEEHVTVTGVLTTVVALAGSTPQYHTAFCGI